MKKPNYHHITAVSFHNLIVFLSSTMKIVGDFFWFVRKFFILYNKITAQSSDMSFLATRNDIKKFYLFKSKINFEI